MTRTAGTSSMLEEIHAATPPQAKSAGVSGGKKRAAPGADTEDHVDPLAVAQRTPPAAAHARTPNEEITPTPTKKRRNAKPFRIEIGPPKEGEEREHVNKPNGRYNKNGVCFHKASGKWRAIVYVGKRQVNLGYFTSQEQAEGTIENARTHGLPKGFTGLRALQQPKQSNHAGVNWDKHTKKWLARVYEPSKPGGKGKEHKVGYYLDEDEAVKAIEVRRKEMGLPPSKRGRKKEVNEDAAADASGFDLSDPTPFGRSGGTMAFGPSGRGVLDMGSPGGPAASVASSMPRLGAKGRLA